MEKVKERMLAHVEEVVNIQPIEGCDNIEYVTVLGWNVIQRKNSVKIGDKVVYIEIDSKVPENEIFAFLESKKYKVKSIKMRGVISQGLIMTFEDLKLDASLYNIGDDVTEVLGITKINTEEEQRLKSEEDAIAIAKSSHAKFFNNPLVKKLMRFRWFRKLVIPKKKESSGFPNFIHKTDETRIENMPSLLNDNEKVWLQTEKIDGTSSTYAIHMLGKKKHEFIVCSRNVRQAHKMTEDDLKKDPNKYWEIALRYNIENVLLEIQKNAFGNYPVIILQGEIIGERIQGNPYKLKGTDFYGYNLIFCNPKTGIYHRYSSDEGKKILNYYGIKWVPILGTTTLPATMEEMKSQAEGESQITKGVKREGIVYRSEDGQESFKNVSNSYLLKHNG